MSNLRDAPDPETLEKTKELLLRKAKWSRVFLDQTVLYIISGNDPSAIEYGEGPDERFEKIVHAHNTKVGKGVRYKGHKGTIEEVVPLAKDEVGELKDIGRYKPQKPFKYSIRWEKGVTTFLWPTKDGFRTFTKKKEQKQQKQIS